MDTRFAGSQRLGDRRRRRLAVETEEARDAASSAVELPAAPGKKRLVDRAGVETVLAPLPAAIALPATLVIPIAWWKYLIGAVLSLAITAGTLIAGWRVVDWSAASGPEMNRLFDLADPSIAKWLSSVLLFVSAQLALLIWRARSQSLKDFSGRYRLWTRAACVWFVMSGCIATGAHDAFGEMLLHLWPTACGCKPLHCWLIPATVCGVWIVVALGQEMAGCRTSRILLCAAASWYLVSIGARLELNAALLRNLRDLAIWGGVLAGSVSIFLSMWVHARHVLHCTADPTDQRAPTWRIKRPHFRLRRLRFPGRKAGVAGTAEKAREARFESKSPVDGEPRDKPPAEAADSHPAIAELAPSPAAPAKELSVHGASDGESCRSADDESDQGSSQPDLRGLSKKQRRRLMQEIRDRERAAGCP
jgi:hypothetical protein